MKIFSKPSLLMLGALAIMAPPALAYDRNDRDWHGHAAYARRDWHGPHGYGRPVVYAPPVVYEAPPEPVESSGINLILPIHIH